MSKQQVDLEFLQRWFAIVERTAKLGLEESFASDDALRKWFLIWCCDISGELGEIDDFEISNPFRDGCGAADICEVGDVMWGISALWQLNQLPLNGLLYQDTNIVTPFQAILLSLKLLDHGKKLLRDGKARQPDKELVKGVCVEILYWLGSIYDLNKALDAVEAKLLKRYPDGFTPEASVNRVV